MLLELSRILLSRCFLRHLFDFGRFDLLIQSRSGPKDSLLNRKSKVMKPIFLAGIVLVVLGALVLAYQGFSYTRHEHVLDVGPMHVTTETQDRVPISPIVGGLALVAGIVLLAVGGKKSS